MKSKYLTELELKIDQLQAELDLGYNKFTYFEWSDNIDIREKYLNNCKHESIKHTGKFETECLTCSECGFNIPF